MTEKTENAQQEALSLVQKLVKIREIADVVTKSKKGYGYTYADINDILAKIRAGMKKYGVSLIPHIVQGTMTEVTDLTEVQLCPPPPQNYENGGRFILVSAKNQGSEESFCD